MEKGNGVNNNTVMAVLCYLGILVVIPLLTEAKHDSFVKFHIKQGLVLLIAGVIAGVVGMIPFLGWFLLGPILWMVCLILAIMGIVNAVGGHEKALPLIGQYANKIEI